MSVRSGPRGVSADGRLLVTGSDDNSVRSWSLPGGEPLGEPLHLPGGPSGVERFVGDFELSPGGRWAVLSLVDQAGAQRGLEVWDLRDRRRVANLDVSSGYSSAGFSPDARLLAIGHADGTSQVWSTATWRPVTRKLAGAASGIESVAIGHDGRTLATGNNQGTVSLWDIETEQAIGAPLPADARGSISIVAPYFLPGDSALIASYDSGRARRWDLRPDSLARRACEVAGRRLTRAEWDEFLPGRDYDPAC